MTLCIYILYVYTETLLFVRKKMTKVQESYMGKNK